MANHYHLSEYGVNSMPITGQYLDHTQKSRVERAFIAADLFVGAKHIINPTLVQSAYVASVNRTYAWWATKRQAERVEIEAGLIPLVPPSHFAPKACSTVNTLPVPQIEIPDRALVEFVRAIGVGRVLDAAVLAEAAE
jgi:hypothetical protein